MVETFVVEKTTWKELEELGYMSVTDYCRHLVKQGKKLPDRIEVYRGEMLCMTVTDVAEAAKLEPATYGFTKYSSGKGLKARRSPAKPRGDVKTSTVLPHQPEDTKTSVEALAKLMEEMANQPKEPFGTRQPGERGMYEIQRKERYPLAGTNTGITLGDGLCSVT